MPAALIQPSGGKKTAMSFVLPIGSVLILQNSGFKLISTDLFPHCRLKTRRSHSELGIALAGRPADGLHSLGQQKSPGTFPVIPANGQKLIN